MPARGRRETDPPRSTCSSLPHHAGDDDRSGRALRPPTSRVDVTRGERANVPLGATMTLKLPPI